MLTSCRHANPQAITHPRHTAQTTGGPKSSCRTSCEKSFSFSIYPWSPLCPQLNGSQAAVPLPSLIKFSRRSPLKDLRREGCVRWHNVWTAPLERSEQICVKSKGPPAVPSVFRQDARCHRVPWERLISWQRILMWHLAVEEYHLGNGRGAVLWPGIIHSAHRQTGGPSLSSELHCVTPLQYTSTRCV